MDLMAETFGEFISQKRAELGLSLRAAGKLLGLSQTYLLNMEQGLRPAPSPKIQMKIAKVYELTPKESFLMYDLATKTKKDGTVPVDIALFVNKSATVRSLIRYAMLQEVTPTRLRTIYKEELRAFRKAGNE